MGCSGGQATAKIFRNEIGSTIMAMSSGTIGQVTSMGLAGKANGTANGRRAVPEICVNVVILLQF